MLIAESRGKYVPDVQGNEDYLTSAIFGHLRYIPPGPFWHGLFDRAHLTVAGSPSLSSVLWPNETIQNYSALAVQFWKQQGEFGEPDLWLTFRGAGQPDLHLFCEVKLDSPKSGFGQDDQLVRYARALDSMSGGADDHRWKLVYLTPRNSCREIEESLSNSDQPERHRRMIYQLQWQDLLCAAHERICVRCSEIESLILADVERMLKFRGLEYFDRFTQRHGPLLGTIPKAAFTTSVNLQSLRDLESRVPTDGPKFSSFTRSTYLQPMTPREAGWRDD